MLCVRFVALGTLWTSAELVQPPSVAMSLRARGVASGAGRTVCAWLISLSCVSCKVCFLPRIAFVSLPSRSQAAPGPDASLDPLSSWDVSEKTRVHCPPKDVSAN